jgi:hypothetical protein
MPNQQAHNATFSDFKEIGDFLDSIENILLLPEQGLCLKDLF